MYRIAVDIGGTFTDGVIENTETSRIWIAKSLSTPASPGDAVSRVIRDLLEKAGASPDAVTEVVHGNTIVTNTLIERRGVRTALVTTGGMTDLIEMGREVRYDLYDLHLELPPPLVPAELRLGVSERMAADGTSDIELSDAEVERVAGEVRALGPQSVAIAFLHSNVADRHEVAMAQGLRARLGNDIAISVSSHVAGEIREYERTTTATANAYVQPLVETYLRELEGRLRALGISAPVLIMVSSGGFTSAAAAADTPITLLESGPAGGVISAAHAGKAAGLHNVLAFDMGGTTAKLCVVIDGEPSVAHSFETARVHRFKRGSGLPILIPSIDLIEIGAGGGSVATVNALGLLKVGPESAGSVPGPACYGNGGTEPTVTDADLVLGYLDPANFLGGEIALDVGKAREALAHVGAGIGLDALQTATGIVDIVNESMAAAARVHIAEKGHDPRSFTLVATGGAGPLHAVSVAQRLGVGRIVFPIAVGAGSCLGFLAAPARADRAWSRIAPLAGMDWDELGQRLTAMRGDAEAELTAAGSDPAACQWSVVAEMRFGGQGTTIPVSLPYRLPGEDFAGELVALFTRRYAALFGGVVPSARPEVVTWRVIAVGGEAHGSFHWPLDAGEAVTPKGRRSIYLPRTGAMGEVPVYDRYRLPPGAELAAPAIIEERESTLAIPLPARVRVLADRAILVELDA
ncbi:MAG: hydantoinase/oxoprolinase family protein [Xanthobacteraceae bacterium]|jgi:N-methylhydantoinase A|nr:hydantoinase/oxoprolinase family protein [Xanthobacteraceae bacterium]